MTMLPVSRAINAELNLIEKMEIWWASVLKKMGHHSVMWSGRNTSWLCS